MRTIDKGDEDKNALSLYQMETMAYIFDSERLRKGKLGFCSPKEYRDSHSEEKHELVMTDPVKESLR